MRISYIFFFTASMLFESCCSSHFTVNQKQISGIYQNKEFNSQLQFTDSSFVYIIKSKNYNLGESYSDTAALGLWHLDGHHYIALNSPDWIKSPFIEYSINENFKEPNDTIYFYFKSPIEQEYKKNNKYGSELSYSLSVVPEAGTIDHFKENNQIFENTVIKYFNPERLRVESFSITLQAKSTMPVRYLSVRNLITMPYKVKNNKSNSFEIYFPNLTYTYFNLKRLYEDYLKIVNNQTLYWDGVYYTKIK